ncbi:unnamed protein product [Nippostrongylus brasiliensis]|uniref:FMRFamide-like peptide 8 (inferred by orthology to a C. elegans protein) n=1 Tax=Nippostrongylus brasiliensis TaxID=27835 RepID=A0A0N4Y2Y4_NIPBR|nr:unnamed protein product [Nippostrongylus brasiliensis]
MLFGLLVAAIVASGVSYECDLTQLPEQLHDLGRRVCRLENKLGVLDAVAPDALQGSEFVINDEEAPNMEKRKNEFIRFGKRSTNDVVKRKNEFIRFGKRKNEFIRYDFASAFDLEGHRTQVLAAPVVSELEKRKNEFIRFG